MERNYYVEVTVNSNFSEILHQSTTLFDYQSAVDSVKYYVDYLRKCHPADCATMIGSFVHPYDSTITLYAKQLINGKLYYLGLRKFTYYGN